MTDKEQPIDPNVRDLIDDQKRLARGAARESAEKERKLRRLSGKLLAAIRARDQRLFANLLREAGVKEQSVEWARAWKLFWTYGG